MNESTASMGMMILWMVVIFGVMYFLMIRPQKKEQKRLQAMLNSMEVGDSIVTTGGFYGVIIDMTEEDVIVEFGNMQHFFFWKILFKEMCLYQSYINTF